MPFPGEITTGELVSAAGLNSLPGGVLGYAEVTANQTGITTETDLTGLSVTVTVADSRRIKITYFGAHEINTVDNRVVASIKESTTTLAFLQTHHSEAATPGRHNAYGAAVITPSSGSHTYKVTMLAPDAGSASLAASATGPAFILVEDIGPA